MHIEVSIGLNFVISYLYNKLPRRRVDFFAEELEKEIKRKFESHWYPEKPFKGSAYRCIKASGEKIDPVMELAAVSCALDITEIQEYLPKDLTIWIDPNEVSYRIGEKGIVKILYSDRKETEENVTEFSIDSEIQVASKSFNPEAQSFRPIETLSTSLNNLSLSPADGSSPTSPWGSASPTQGVLNSSTGSSPINSFLNRGNNSQSYMTAASFAATKFGSTKLKSQAKRPNRLSPTDFGTFVKQRQMLQQSHWINGVGAVSPMGSGAAVNAINGLPSPHGYPSSLAAQQFINQQTHAAAVASQQQQQQQHTNSLSPRNDFVERQRLLLLQQQLQQQQQQQQKLQQLSQLQNNNILGNYGGSLKDMHQLQSQHQHQQQLSQLSPNLQQYQPKVGQQQHPLSSSMVAAAYNTNNSLFSNNSGNNESFTNALNVKCPDLVSSNSALQSNGSATAASTAALESTSSSNASTAGGNPNDNINWNSLPPYAHLQHLLVAN